MKHSYLSILTITLLTACADISTDDRYMAVESIAPARTVIVEDFTGQNCINCPAAHETLNKLVEQYGDAIIPVSIHAGTFGIAADNTRYTGLMQPEGNTYNDNWNITEWPKGMINRNGLPANPDEWPTLVREEIARPTNLGINIEASYTEGSDNFAISVTMTPTADIEGNLQLWVIEDSIVARQRDFDRGLIQDYVHNFVYRASVNGIGGERISLISNIHTTAEYDQALRTTATETWNPEHLSVVAFVYNNTGVIQAARTRLVTK